MDASETYDTAKSNNSPVRPAWPSFSVSSSCIISSISTIQPVDAAGLVPPEVPRKMTERFRERDETCTHKLGKRYNTLRKTRVFIFTATPDELWSGCPAMEAEFLCLLFCFAFFSDTIYPRERQRTTSEIRFHDWTRSGNGSEPRKKPIPGAFPLLLRSGSLNQPSFCVFLLFSVLLPTAVAALLTLAFQWWRRRPMVFLPPQSPVLL